MGTIPGADGRAVGRKPTAWVFLKKKILAGPHFIFLVLRNFKYLPVLHHKIMEADGSWLLAGSPKSHRGWGMDQSAHLLTWEGRILSIVFFICGLCFLSLLMAPLRAHEKRVSLSLSLCPFSEFTSALLTPLHLRGSSQSASPSLCMQHLEGLVNAVRKINDFTSDLVALIQNVWGQKGFRFVFSFGAVARSP